MIMEWTRIDDLDAEIFGRSIVKEAGRLAKMRGRFHLSVRRTAQLLSTAGQVVARWEAEPDCYQKIYRGTAVRLGQLAHHMDEVEQHLYDKGILVSGLLPITVVAGDLGLSPSSKLILDKCQTGELHCFSLGNLGIYIPELQADELRRKGLR
jgi:hypothetical protein